MNIAGLFARRNLLKATAVLGGLSMLSERTASAQADQRDNDGGIEGRHDAVRMADIPPSSTAKITVERRGPIVLIGINRPYIHNRVDPETFLGLAKAYYQYDHDPPLRAAVLFGHGDDYSRGIDVDAFQAAVASDRPRITEPGAIDPLARTAPILSKPLVVAVHGDTWNMGHELYLAADIRVAAADTRFGQDENTHGRFPGGGATIRFVREAGWGNAIRYMLTGITGALKRPHAWESGRKLPLQATMPGWLGGCEGVGGKEARRRNRASRPAAGRGKRPSGSRCRFSRRRKPHGSPWRA